MLHVHGGRSVFSSMQSIAVHTHNVLHTHGVERSTLHMHGLQRSHHVAHARRSAFSVARRMFSQDMYPIEQHAADGITFMKTMLKNRGFWSGPVVDVSRCPPIAPPTKRRKNEFVIAQAWRHV